VLGERDWFPYPLPAPQVGWAADYVVIERRGPKEYLAHFQSSSGLGQIAEKGEHEFITPEEAAGYYLKWALHLPGDLDGWKVIA